MRVLPALRAAADGHGRAVSFADELLAGEAVVAHRAADGERSRPVDPRPDAAQRGGQLHACGNQPKRGALDGAEGRLIDLDRIRLGLVVHRDRQRLHPLAVEHDQHLAVRARYALLGQRPRQLERGPVLERNVPLRGGAACVADGDGLIVGEMSQFALAGNEIAEAQVRDDAHRVRVGRPGRAISVLAQDASDDGLQLDALRAPTRDAAGDENGGTVDAYLHATERECVQAQRCIYERVGNLVAQLVGMTGQDEFGDTDHLSSGSWKNSAVTGARSPRKPPGVSATCSRVRCRRACW